MKGKKALSSKDAKTPSESSSNRDRGIRSLIRELPPTAGMPLHWSDFLPGKRRLGLQESLAAFLGVPSVHLECSGTAALVIALESLKKLSRRRNVLVPGYTCPLVAIAIAQAGLQIKPVDTRYGSFDFDLDALRSACDNDTLCIIATHLGGLPADIDSILEIAGAQGAYVVEDAAQALGSRHRGQMVGTFGDIGFFSLTRGKGLSIYEGGALVARDHQMRKLLEETHAELVGTDIFAETIKLIELIGYKLFYNPQGLVAVYGLALRYWLAKKDLVRAVGEQFDEHVELYEVSRLRSSIGAAALVRLPETIRENAERGRSRAQKIGSLPGVDVLQEGDGDEGTWPFLMIRFANKDTRDAALDRLWKRGLGVTRLFIHALPDYSYLSHIVPKADLPDARSFAERTLTLTNSYWLSDREFEEVLKELKTVAVR